MAKFQELNEYINTILIQLIGSQNLCKLLYYPSLTPLSQPTLTDTTDLLFNQIYPLPKIPSTALTTGNFLTLITDNAELSSNKGFKTIDIIFNIICHIDEWRLNGGIRPLLIANEIDKLFNNQRIVGIGRMDFERMTFVYYNEKFSGYKIIYTATDFN